MSKQDAIRQFTDRTEPQAAFAKAYLDLAGSMPGSNFSRVLTYYGMGGIGKTTLLTKLQDNLQNDPQLSAQNKGKPQAAYYNLESNQEDIKVLTALKNLLSRNYKWKFPRFEIGLYLYYTDLGMETSAPSAETFSDRRPELKVAMDVASELPLFGPLIKVLSILDQGQAAVRTLLKQHSALVKDFKELTTEEQKEALPGLFAADLNAYTEKSASPLVILLDTYECIAERSGTQGAAFGRDYWLYGEHGLIPSTKNTLWVIAGRQKIRWQAAGCPMEQHLLGSLSPEDSASFLASAGGIPESLIPALCRLTGGTPLYLDVCVHQYRQLLRHGITPEISLFGDDDSGRLIQCYARYMDKSEKSLVYLLSFLPEWDETLARLAAENVLGSFSLPDLHRILGLSITTESSPGRYFIHRTVAEILRNTGDNLLQEKTAKFLIDHASQVLETASPYSDTYSQALSLLLHGGLLLYKDRNELMVFYRENMLTPLNALNQARRRDQLRQIFSVYLEKAEEVKDDALYADALVEKAWRACQCAGIDNDVLEWAMEALQLHTRLFGHEDFETLRTLHMLAIFLELKKKTREAIPLYEYLIQKLQALHPDRHSVRLNAKRNMALSYNSLRNYDRTAQLMTELIDDYRTHMGPESPNYIRAIQDMSICHRDRQEYDQARALGEEALQLCRLHLGSEHPDTLHAINSLNITCDKLGDTASAVALSKELYELRCKLQGATHPDTLRGMRNLATAYSKDGDHQSALRLRKEYFKLCQELYGDAHMDTITSMNLLAVAHGKLEEHQQELSLREQALKLLKKNLGITARDTQLHMLRLAQRYGQLGQYEKAVPLLQELLDILPLRKDDELTTYQTAFLSMEKACRALGDEAQRKALYPRALKRFIRQWGDTNWRTMSAVIKLCVQVCSIFGSWADAAWMQTQCLWLCKQGKVSIHPVMMENLSECYLHIEKYEEALKLLWVLLEYQKQHQQPLSKTISRICRALDALGRTQEAEQMREEAQQALLKELEAQSSAEGIAPATVSAPKPPASHWEPESYANLSWEALTEKVRSQLNQLQWKQKASSLSLAELMDAVRKEQEEKKGPKTTG